MRIESLRAGLELGSTPVELCLLRVDLPSACVELGPGLVELLLPGFDIASERVELGLALAEVPLALHQRLLGGRELGSTLLELRPFVRVLGNLRLEGREPITLGAEQTNPAGDASLTKLELAPISLQLPLSPFDRLRPLAQALLQRLELLVGLDGTLLRLLVPL